MVSNSAAGVLLTAGSQAGFSPGVTVQSIGGGGGVGGFNFVGIVAAKGNPVTIAVGGSGGVGGDAGDVTVVRGYLEDGTISRSLINVRGRLGRAGGAVDRRRRRQRRDHLAFATGSTAADQTGFGGQFIIGGDGASSGDGRSLP